MIQSVSLCRLFIFESNSFKLHYCSRKSNIWYSNSCPIKKKSISNHLSAAVITLNGRICKVIITIMIAALVQGNNIVNNHNYCITITVKR